MGSAFLLTLLLVTLSPSARALEPDALRRVGLMGDCVAARAHLATPEGASSEPARLLVGLCAIEQPLTDPTEAETVLSSIPESSDLGAYARYLRARAILEADQPRQHLDKAQAEKAVALLQGISLPFLQQSQTSLLRAKALVLAGRGAEARTQLLALAGTAVDPEARWWLGEEARLRGASAEARELWTRLWVAKPGHRFADRAAASLEDCGFPVPDFNSEAGRTLALERAKYLKEAHQAPAALQILREIERRGGVAGAPAELESGRWIYRVTDTCFEARDYRCAVEGFERLGSPRAAKVTGGVETIFQHALALTRLGKHAESSRVYQSLFELHPTTKQADLASFKIGYVALDRADFAAAVKGFREHLARYPSSAHADEARWFLGWCLYRLGDVDGAQLAWAQVSASSYLAPYTSYWRARTAPSERQMELFRAVRRSWPSSGASWLSGFRLGMESGLVWPDEPATPPLPAANLATSRDLRVAEALFSVGMDEEAAIAFVSLSSTIKDPLVKSAIAFRLVRAGRVKPARKLVTCGAAKTPQAMKLEREICHPRPHAEIVQGILGGTGLDPFLPYAIMTAESAMTPSVTSPAGAVGLMQLMPEVGRRLHEAASPDRPYYPDNLYRSGYNASLGTRELLRLYNHYLELGVPEPLPLVIAAYNAGEEPVDRWLDEARRTQRFDLDTFCEDISYTETRKYVRTVLGYLEGYHRAYGLHQAR